jgi:hypothetical protein
MGFAWVCLINVVADEFLGGMEKLNDVKSF